MKTFIGILIGISLMFAFQKIMKEKDKPTTGATTALQSEKKLDIPPDFLLFYTKFHTDSLYQVEHITFPLEGMPPYNDSLAWAQPDFKWQKESWKMHKILKGRENSFLENLVPMGKDLIFEFTPTDDKKLWVARRFLKSNGEWKLIYYAGLNKKG